MGESEVPGRYEDRASTDNSDGTPLFASDHDKQNESELIRIVQKHWRNIIVHPFGRLCVLDFWVEQDGRMIGIMELKSRSHASDRFPDVFLNVRKWIALLMASHGLGVPAVFVARFTDKTGYCSIRNINARNMVIAGCRNIVKSHTDIEPVIKIPITMFKWFGERKKEGAENST